MANELQHHGILGMKWGVRRFQNRDGSLTPAGKKRKRQAYDDLAAKKEAYKSAKKAYNKSYNKADALAIAAFSPIKKHRQANDARWEDAADKATALNKAKSDYKTAKKAAKDAKKAEKAKQKVLEKKYGELEDQMTYGKNADPKKNAAIQKQLDKLDQEMSGGKQKTSKKDSYHEDYKKAHDSKNVKNMSDAELRSRLNRLNMEKQYSQLSDTNVNKGKQYFDTTLKVATTVATVTTTGLTIYNNADKIKKIVEPMIKKGK